MLIKSQSEVRLYTGRSVHFHPIPFTRPSFIIFKGLVPRLTRVGGGGGSQVNVTLFWQELKIKLKFEPKI